MNERNMLCSSHEIHDLANGQQVQSHVHPDPCIPMGNTQNFHLSHVGQVLPPLGNLNFDLHHLPEHAGRPAFFGMTQYNQPSHPATNLELGIPTASNFFNLHLNPAPGARVFPVPLNNGFVDHSASSSNYRSNAVSFGEYGRSNFPTEDVRELCKRKNAEGMSGNIQHFGASAGPSSSSAAPMISCHFDSAPASMDAPLALPEYRGSGTHSMMEVGSGVTARHRSGGVGLRMDSGMLNNYNYLPQGNYGNQSFPASGTWLEQQALNNGGLPWNGHPMLPYFHGSNIHGGASDLRSGGLSTYTEASSNHSSANFLPSPPILQQHHNLHPSQNMQGVRGYGVACYPPFLAGPTRVPTNDGVQHEAITLSPENSETTSRPTGIRIYRSHGRSMLPDAASRRRDFPRLRNLQADRVAILEFPNLYEVDFDDFNDHHRDMRLDIDDMSYEELLALSERIGTVNTGLSEDDITGHLKTKRYRATRATINLEELPCIDQNNDSCIICQDEYEDRDKLGTLECGHEYHAECLKKWLLVKNVCPICKSPALKVERNDR
ncbi:hypothetical protein RND81_09G014500 [Saponaria officinalis]|uniref:RING-type E3 ubiquitin transferase n=1 Tax=Saponaria officinalis TaxID=3572 RepID=A0AAW1IHK1_SAPOF